MMTTKLLFVGIVIAVLAQRLSEVRLSQRNVASLLSQGGQIQGANALGWVKALQLSWFVLMIVEVWTFDRPFIPGLAAIALLASIAGQVLRYFSMQALKQRWTLPLVSLPGVPAVNSGIYQHLRHPNWLGVILEIAALPLIHTAYLTAIVFSIINAFLIAKRVQGEEAALAKVGDYEQLMGDRPRFIPRLKFGSLESLDH